MKKYSLQWNTEVFESCEVKKICKGCIEPLSNQKVAALVANYADQCEALAALENHKSTIERLQDAYLVTEYYVEEYNVDDSGDYAGGSEFYFAEFDEASLNLISEI